MLDLSDATSEKRNSFSIELILVSSFLQEKTKINNTPKYVILLFNNLDILKRKNSIS